MVAIAVQVRLPSPGGIPRDDIVNTMHFWGPGLVSPTALADDVSGPLITLYSVLVPHFSNAISHEAHKIHALMYAMPDLPATAPPAGSGNPRVVMPVVLGGPIRDIDLSASGFTGASGSGLPREVAVCISLHGGLTGLSEVKGGTGQGHLGGTRPRARHRGRIYLGPFTSSALTEGTGSSNVGAQVADVLRTAITGAFTSFLIDLAAATTTPVLSIFSRKAAELVPVIGGWVDDKFDVQRSRGILSAARTTFGAAG